MLCKADERMRFDHGSGEVLMHEILVDGHLWSDIPCIDKCDLQDSDYAKDDAMAVTHLMLILRLSVSALCLDAFPPGRPESSRHSFLLK